MDISPDDAAAYRPIVSDYMLLSLNDAGEWFCVSIGLITDSGLCMERVGVINPDSV